MTDDGRYQELASKWLKGAISDAEKSEFAAWYCSHPDNRFELSPSFAGSEEELKERILAKIRANMNPAPPRTVRFGVHRIVGIAAAILFAISIGVYFWSDYAGEAENRKIVQQDVSPGGNRAMLTLSDGRTIALSEKQSGIVIGKDIRYEDGELIAGRDSNDYQPISYAIMTTPKGGQYQIQLSDGSRVWLNSATSLRYPTQFGNGIRQVELLEGEAYFEVSRQVRPAAHSQKTPFQVITKNQIVEVLGTQFNVNAYADEQGIRTTLVEGAVSINYGKSAKRAVVLAPGDQSMLTENEVSVRNVDTETYTAWKDGYFYFNDADIYTVMKQFERWYDIEVHYSSIATDDLFVGKIPKNVSLSTALRVLKSAGVNFELIDGRRLIVRSEK